MVELTQFAAAQAKRYESEAKIPEPLYVEYGVNRGLRDEKGAGVLTGLTRISKVNGIQEVAGKRVPCQGELWYRGYQISTLVDSLQPGEFGYEKTAYLLLFGEQPSGEELRQFQALLRANRDTPNNFTRDVVMKSPSQDIMNSMTRCILALAAHDPKANDCSMENCIRQSIQLIAQLPSLAVYCYQAYNHQVNQQSLYLHRNDPTLSPAENFLKLLRPDQQYTPLEAQVLDVALMLHMEHGGGNNSTFTTRVVTSSGSDTYSAIGAAMASLKGPKHGGANRKVMEMMADLRSQVSDPTDRDQVKHYLTQLVEGAGYDHSGLIYGIGHAVYTLSDPRELILKDFVRQLAAEKGREADFALYQTVEELAPNLILSHRKSQKPVSPNVDFYSGFVYDLLGIPTELYTPLFAAARIVGWSAHRMEELACSSKIIRPAYMSVMAEVEDAR
jgi:citrate synthase